MSCNGKRYDSLPGYETQYRFTGEDRELFYDEDAMILFDEASGEILFSPPVD